eukprot:TRINITY_DN802_c0_g1_i1.p1 TRINITY_DN802_c0_g1~~TRINITY_DN802_c0_g1_i1.p1  ORF type:complete len:355 (+),score=104.03 TRINITY_DN802_c0_g1_i1:76-1140(+)
MADKAPEKNVEKKGTLPQLLWGAGGIYACFLYYGSLQEDVFKFASEDGEKFKYVWCLQVMEALANVLVGFAALAATGFTRGIPHDLFSMTGFTQVLSKWCTNTALREGVSFPVATLAKSAKMVPVMVGSLFLGGATYTMREYAQVAAIVIGTSIVSLGGGKKSSQESSFIGLFLLVASLCCDGLTGGVQKRLKAKTAEKGIKLKAYDFMFWTNAYMFIVAVLAAVLNGEVVGCIEFCTKSPAIFWVIIRFSTCSALGQSFIFYTISTFDPLTNATVTTTRKIFSVLYSILFKGNSLSNMGWFGVFVACVGVVADIFEKSHESKAPIPKGPSKEDVNEEEVTVRTSPSLHHKIPA